MNLWHTECGGGAAEGTRSFDVRAMEAQMSKPNADLHTLKLAPDNTKRMRCVTLCPVLVAAAVSGRHESKSGGEKEEEEARQNRIEHGASELWLSLSLGDVFARFN